MTVVIRPARRDDVEQVVALLSSKMSTKIGADRWRRLFDYPWRPEDSDLGRVAAEGDRIVGFVGMVYADRTIGGRRERIVNICAWYLEKAYRGHGFGSELMRRATDDPTVTYTILTSSSKTTHILPSIGYRVLDGQRRIWRHRSSPSGAVTVETAAAAQLRDSERRLVADHAGLPVVPLLVGSSGERFLAVVSPKVKAGGIRYWDLLHVGDAERFTAAAQELANVLIGRDENAVLAADLRFTARNGPAGERQALTVPRFFKSSRLPAEPIDNLYSEVQLLDLKLD